MKWLRNLLRRLPAGSHPCCGDYETCQRPCTPRGEYRASRHADKALEALHMLYTETADYIERNHLGPVHHNQSMRMARDALAAAGMAIWYEKPRAPKPRVSPDRRWKRLTVRGE
jgi:hypothetical protein